MGGAIISLLLRKYKAGEIVSVPMDFLFSLKFFERCNDRYYCNMLFTPIELFTYIVIITLIILMLIQLIFQMFFISFSAIYIVVSRLGVTRRQGSFSPLFPAVTSMIGFCPSSFL